MGNIPQPYSEDIRVPRDIAERAQRGADAIASGIAGAAQGIKDFYEPYRIAEETDKRLEDATRTLKLKRVVNDQTTEIEKNIRADTGFSVMSTEDAVRGYDASVGTMLDAALDEGGFSGTQRDYLREEALASKPVQAARENVARESRISRYQATAAALGREINVIGNHALDDPDSIADRLDELHSAVDIYATVLDPQTVDRLLEVERPKLLANALKGFIDKGRFDDARALLNDKGPVAVSSLFSPEQRLEIGQQIDAVETRANQIAMAAAEQAARIEDAQNTVEQATRGEVVLDAKNPADVEKVNLGYTRLLPLLQEMDFSGRADSKAEFIRATNVVPDAIRKEMQRSNVAANDQQIEAALLYDNISRKNPELLDQLGLDEQGQTRLRLISDRLRAGRSTEEAISLTDQQLDPAKTGLRTVRAESFKALPKIQPWEVSYEFGLGVLGMAPVGEMSKTTADRLYSSVNGIYERQYLLTGDNQLSRDGAFEQLRRTWGVSNINGRQELMEYPPERYNTANASDGWARRQLIDEIDRHLQNDDMGYTPDGRKIILDENGEFYTGKMVTVKDPGLNGGQPTNIPLVYAGKEYSQADALKLVLENNGIDPDTEQALPGFRSDREARAAMRKHDQDVRKEIAEIRKPRLEELDRRVYVESDYVTGRTAGSGFPVYSVSVKNDDNISEQLSWVPNSLLAARQEQAALIRQYGDQETNDAESVEAAREKRKAAYESTLNKSR